MGEVDDVQHAVDQRQPQRDQRVDRAGQEAVEDRRKQDAVQNARCRAGDTGRVDQRHQAGIGKTGLALAKPPGRITLMSLSMHLRIDRRGALVLAVDEFGRAIRHDVAGEGRACQRRR